MLMCSINEKRESVLSDDDKIQMKKDLLYEIHEKEKHLAALRTRLDKNVADMQRISEYWEGRHLIASDGNLCVKRDGRPVILNERLPEPGVFAQTVEELGTTKRELEVLRNQLSSL